MENNIMGVLGIKIIIKIGYIMAAIIEPSDT